MHVITLYLLVLGAGQHADRPERIATHQKLHAVPFTAVRVDDAFWAPRIRRNREKTLPHNVKECETTGRIANFAKAAGLEKGEFEGIYFNDSDVYKMLEGAAYTLAAGRDPALDAKVDGIIAKIAAAQQPDGYLNSYYTLVEPDQRWTNLPVRHELYCAGHLFEAAVAHYQATGKRALLDVAIRFADHIDRTFGPGRKIGVPGHEEIELALVKLYRITGNERYLKLARFFIDQRGRDRDPQREYMQAHLPVREQSTIAGHAVRAMYLYSGVADVAAITGEKKLIDTMERVWQDVVLRKMYVTGGIGPSAHNEGFTVAYDLPNDTAYQETCASIGMVLWNQRLLLLHGQRRFADVMERALYNGLLAGVALDGEKFFYVNPLASRGQHHRQAWYGCACCPTNVVRFLPSLGGYIYATSDAGVWVNLYVASTAAITLPTGEVELTQETRYPWDGKVRVTIAPDLAADFAVNLRIPAWCEGARCRVNGNEVDASPGENGYLSIRRRWKASDVIELDLPMEIRRVQAHPRVESNRGRVALQRGPLVYCLEGVDNDGTVRNVALPSEAALTAHFEPDLLDGVTVLRGKGLAARSRPWRDRLYGEAARPKPVDIMAVPYYAWDNRAPGEMVVWIPESAALAEAPMPPTVATQAKPSASHVWHLDSVGAINDGREPRSSDDHGIPRFTWWPRKGSTEWLTVAFDKPQRVSAAEVYWFDDRPAGGCRVPESWRLLYKDGDAWKPVTGAAKYGTARDQFNLVTFDAVETTSLKVEVQLREGFSAGVLEWRLP